MGVVVAAGALPGRALLILLAIRHRVDLTGKPWISLSAGVMRDFGFDRFAKSRALEALEHAGLIRVKRTPGRPALVSLTTKRTRGDDDG